MDSLEWEFNFCLPLSKWLHWPWGYAAKSGQQLLNSTLLQHGNNLVTISILLVRCGQALNLHYKDMQAGTWTLGSPETPVHLDVHSSWIQVLIFIHFMAKKLQTCLVPQSLRDGVLRSHFWISVLTYYFESSPSMNEEVTTHLNLFTLYSHKSPPHNS